MTAAAFYTKGTPDRRSYQWIVLHTMESQEKPTTAETVSEWFCDPKRSPKASAHFCVDSNSAVRIVDDKDVAWAAPGANANGLHIEMAGVAAQTRAQWLDPYSLKVLDRAAQIAADWCNKYGIPARALKPKQVRARKLRGICGHWDVTRAFPDKGSHTDPGRNFPWNVFIPKVQALLKQ